MSLAEANVPYPQLREMDDINPSSSDGRRLVIGANDVTNPAANDRSSPIYGMRSWTWTGPSRSSSSSLHGACYAGITTLCT